MYKITKKYKDFNGVEKEEDFYFNLNKAEILDMELSQDGGLDVRLQRLIKTNDMKEAIKVFKGIILMAYGIKTDDGLFLKTEEARQKFMASAAYGEIYYELATDQEVADRFIKGIIPKENNPIPAPPMK